MPNLGDYLGHLVSEITMARMHADLEAVRVAELYASHPLLRHLSVPRFTLPEVELDLPVLVSGMELPPPGAPPRGGADPLELRRAFDDLLRSELVRGGHPPLTRDMQAKLKEQLDLALHRNARPNELAVDVGRLAVDFSRTAVGTIVASGPHAGGLTTDQAEKLQAALVLGVTVEFLKRRSAPPRLDVRVLTQEIRDAGPTENVTHIKLKVTEHAVEWTTLERDGAIESRLTPE